MLMLMLMLSGQPAHQRGRMIPLLSYPFPSPHYLIG